nr:MAG TPA: hypothetical protein [Caudoviricetes sp.]
MQIIRSGFSALHWLTSALHFMGYRSLFWLHIFTSRFRYRCNWASDVFFMACVRSIRAAMVIYRY